MTEDMADMATVGEVHSLADTTVDIMIITAHGDGAIAATTAIPAGGDGEVMATPMDGEAITARITTIRPIITTDTIPVIIITTAETMLTMPAEGAYIDLTVNLAAMPYVEGPT